MFVKMEKLVLNGNQQSEFNKLIRVFYALYRLMIRSCNNLFCYRDILL